MILLRIPGACKVTIDPFPDEAGKTDDCKQKNRSEIHLACAPERQELILDSETAYDSWKILKGK